jgi:hypothetical protein
MIQISLAMTLSSNQNIDKTTSVILFFKSLFCSRYNWAHYMFITTVCTVTFITTVSTVTNDALTSLLQIFCIISKDNANRNTLTDCSNEGYSTDCSNEGYSTDCSNEGYSRDCSNEGYSTDCSNELQSLL